MDTPEVLGTLLAAPESPPASSLASAPKAQTAPPRPNTVLWIELLVVLALAVVPPLVNAIIYIDQPTRPPTYAMDALAVVLSSTQIGAVILFLMWRSSEGFAGFGLRSYRPVRDTLLALGLFAALWFSHDVLWFALWRVPGVMELYEATAPAQSVFPTPSSSTDFAAVIILSIANGFSEELVISAYLISRFRTLLNSSTKAILLSSTLFASYHVYQGVWALPPVFIGGLLFGTAFVATGRFWPLALAHALFDAVALLTQ